MRGARERHFGFENIERVEAWLLGEKNNEFSALVSESQALKSELPSTRLLGIMFPFAFDDDDGGGQPDLPPGSPPTRTSTETPVVVLINSFR